MLARLLADTGRTFTVPAGLVVIMHISRTTMPTSLMRASARLHYPPSRVYHATAAQDYNGKNSRYKSNLLYIS